MFISATYKYFLIDWFQILTKVFTSGGVGNKGWGLFLVGGWRNCPILGPSYWTKLKAKLIQ